MKLIVFLSFINIMERTITLKIPPERLITPATAPLVTKAKRALRSAMYNAPEKPKTLPANIVTMFESPTFAPAGRKGTDGKIRFSKTLRTNESAPSKPKTQIFFVFESSVRNCVELLFSVFKLNNNLVRKARGGVSVF